MSFSGHYYSGRDTRREIVDVSVTPEGLTLRRVDGPASFWPYAEIRLPMKPGPGGPVHFERGAPLPETLVFLDGRILDRIHEIAPRESARFPRPAGSRQVLGLAFAGLAAFVGLLLLAYFQGIPRLADRVAARIPVAWEEKLGQAVFASMAPEASRCTDPELTATLERLVARLQAADPTRPYTLRIAVVDTAAVNAFAAPGGYIVVYAGLLERMDGPDEVAGVLAHEIQHVWLRHSTRSLLRRASAWLLLSLVTGDGGALSGILQSADNLATLAYSRGDEETADREGLRLMRAARLDPAAMIGAYRKLKEVLPETPGVVSYLSTHPETAVRIGKLEAMAVGADAPPTPFPLNRPWSELRLGCRAGR